MKLVINVTLKVTVYVWKKFPTFHGVDGGQSWEENALVKSVENFTSMPKTCQSGLKNFSNKLRQRFWDVFVTLMQRLPGMSYKPTLSYCKIIFGIYTRCQQIDVFQNKVNSSVRKIYIYIYILRPNRNKKKTGPGWVFNCIYFCTRIYLTLRNIYLLTTSVNAKYYL